MPACKECRKDGEISIMVKTGTDQVKNYRTVKGEREEYYTTYAVLTCVNCGSSIRIRDVKRVTRTPTLGFVG